MNVEVDVFTDRDILFTNLALLGLYECTVLPDAYSGVELGRSMFTGASPNTKGLEVVLWFLLSRLDERLASEASLTRVKQSRDFVTVAFKWLEQLKKEGRLWTSVAFRKSYLEDCRGEKLEQILCALSSHVLDVVAEREFPAAFQVKSTENAATVDDTLQREMEHFVAEAAFRGRVTDRLAQAGAFIEKEAARLESRETELLRRKRKLEQIDLSAVASEASEQLDKVSELRKRWRAFDDWAAVHLAEHDLLQEPLEGRARRVLDGAALRVGLSGEQLRAWEARWRQYEISLVHDGKIDLASLVRLWRMSHEHRDNVPDPDPDALVREQQRMQQMTAQHQGHHAALAAMSARLRERARQRESAIVDGRPRREHGSASLFHSKEPSTAVKPCDKHPALAALNVASIDFTPTRT
ncbi:HAUS augmin-like complex subunit 6 N-terminus-domain-containing protein [Thamnocephalis sphaerospora]|uniref:HAUS augmin-like complex subunit 6 N-terminus-domain-containing protein n=1 Tax=Thamnocephalis sphaerospora TaxID=78915 RepID=A0A4P9XZ50_9FUNG|nr:HAUS augmin-like complex subunit 6 N-terminus-domain-containing protein [Thamnocephalis sphaerospora]|eukprot:RKP11011.1 HAUS augmin-like complex subunit 6 N-terminus-domain-containing protein [Thamnocephalis sphaerospora]